MSKLIGKWLVGGLFVAWLIAELVAAFDGSANTWPLTQELVTYLPPWVVIPAAVALALWIVPHFIANYRRKASSASKEAAMTAPVPAPVNPAAVDAKARALRTLAQGLAVDVISTTAMVAATNLGDLRWTRAYWIALGLLLGKTAVTSAVSYIARTVVPPASL